VDFLVSVEAAKLHLNDQMSVRKEITERLQRVKSRLDGGVAPGKKVVILKSRRVYDLGVPRTRPIDACDAYLCI